MRSSGFGRRQVSASIAALTLGLLSSAAVAQDGNVEHGRYVSLLGDCTACHTAEGGKPYAGGLALNSPYGAIYSANVTPDPETGIGSWTRDDFIRAMRQGVRKDGEYIYPAMPYVHYTKMTDQDVNDLWAFMQTIEPVKNVPPENELTFPFNIRTGVGAWQQMFLDEGRFEPRADKSDEWNRGAYIVESLAHCAMCHTPRNLLGAANTDLSYTGAGIDNWYAPNISTGPSSALKDWSVEELATYLKTGSNDKNVAVVGPMTKVVHESMSKLTDQDVHAIAFYIKNMEPPPSQPEREDVGGWTAAEQQEGAQLYGMHCQTCHQSGGSGVENLAPTLAGNSVATGIEPDSLIMAILGGFPAGDKWGRMPGFASVLSDRQIELVSNYVRTSWGNGSEPDVTAWLVGTKRSAMDAPAAGADTQATFACPKFAAYTLDQQMQDQFATLGQGGVQTDELKQLIQSYKGAHPQSSKGDVVGAFITGYCPVIAQSDASYAEKGSQLASFVGKVSRLAGQGTN